MFNILNGYENIGRNCFSVKPKKDRRTRVLLAKEQCRLDGLDIRMFSYPKSTVNEWNRIRTRCLSFT